MSSRNLDATLGASLPSAGVGPLVLAAITLKSGVEYVWTGVGNLVWNGQTFSGLGEFASMGPIAEGSAVKADGTTIQLSGIGLSGIAVPSPPGVTPPDPPFPPAPGVSVAWAYATIPPATDILTRTGMSGSASGDLHSGSLALSGGAPLGANGVGLSWSGFSMPLQIPAGAVIKHVYPVFVVSGLQLGGFMQLTCTPPSVGQAPASGVNVLADVGTLSAATFMGAGVQNSVPGSASLGMAITFLGLAVYYAGAPLPNISLLQEALNDIKLGAPVKIWYGHWLNGALLGTPYLIFGGTVDKPTVQIDEKSSAITLALENRLVNLQRANQRRYTAADQRLAYPTDTGFNWVEILNDRADRWGG